MPYLISNIPHFKCWVRREFTHNHEQYQGEYLHALAIAVNTIPDRSLSFQVVFTGEEGEGFVVVVSSNIFQSDYLNPSTLPTNFTVSQMTGGVGEVTIVTS